MPSEPPALTLAGEAGIIYAALRSQEWVFRSELRPLVRRPLGKLLEVVRARLAGTGWHMQYTGDPVRRRWRLVAGEPPRLGPLSGVDLSAYLRLRLAGHAEPHPPSQAQIAHAMGVHPTVLALWVRGARPVPQHRLADMARALGLTDEELRAQETGIGPIPPSRREELPQREEQPKPARARAKQRIVPAGTCADPLCHERGVPCQRWQCRRCDRYWLGEPSDHICRTAGASSHQAMRPATAGAA